MGRAMKLYGYWRSTAAWRVRLALGMKGLACEYLPVNLVAGEQRSAAHLAMNPQGLLPVLEHDGAVLTQSLAIIEYLDEVFPTPPLLPADALGRARVRSAALAIAADVHPLGNLRVQRWLRSEMRQDDAAVTRWLHQWMADGLSALEIFAKQYRNDFLYGDLPCLADICLIPQLYNARRYGLSVSDYPRLTMIEARICEESWAVAAHPDAQSDSP